MQTRPGFLSKFTHSRNMDASPLHTKVLPVVPRRALFAALFFVKFRGPCRREDFSRHGSYVPWKPPSSSERLGMLDLAGESGTRIYHEFPTPLARLTGLLCQTPSCTAKCNNVSVIFRPGCWVIA